jgi:Ca2+-binding EF-hand superfamily protein
MNMTEYAKSLVKQYDKNGDNMLQPEEQKELRGRAAASDLNHDGVITIDELVANLSSNAPATTSTTASTSGSGSSSSSSSDSDSHHHHDGDDKKKTDNDTSKRVLYGSAGGAASGTKDGDKRHSYRFTPAAERTAEQLPSRFKAMDKNGDGQVDMSEFSRTWSKSTAEEFERYDLDGDGVITVKEATQKSSAKGG